MYSDVKSRTRPCNARSMARARGPSARVAYETHIMVSGTTFIAPFPDRLVDVVVGQPGALKRPRRLRPLPLPCLVVELFQQSEQLVALLVRHPAHDRHDFFDHWHVCSPVAFLRLTSHFTASATGTRSVPSSRPDK